MLLFVLMHSLISCSSTEDVGLEEEKGTGSKQDMPIDFSVDAVSRAVDLSTVHDNFCVRSFKENADGTKSLVMLNYLVKNIDNEWVYNGLANVDGGAQYLKYWDLTANSYTFAAVTPATAAGSTFSIDDNGIATINIADMATEWMIARTIRRGVNNASALLDYDDIAEDIEAIDASATKTSDVFPKPNAPYAEVPLNFHRIMAKIVIKAYAESETEFKPLAVGLNNIGTAPATYNTSTGWTTTAVDHQPLYNQNTIITNEQNSRETALQLTELFVIPQQPTDASGCSLVQINVKTDDNDDSERSFNIPNIWEPNNVYIYYLKFDGGETGEIILFDVTVEPMTKGGEEEKEQTNW